MKKYKNLLAETGLLLTAAVWGSTFFIVKDGLQFINPITLVAYRFFFASVILGIYLIVKKKNIFVNLRQGLALGFLLWLLYVPQTIGLVYTSASNSGFITGLFVVFVPIFAFLIFRRIPSLIRAFAVLIAVLGLWFLTGGIAGINKGDLLTLITAVAYALHLLMADNFLKNKADPLVLAAQQFFFVGILSFIAAFITKASFSIASTNILWLIIFLTFFPTLAANVMQLVGQKIVAPVKVALIFTMEPVFAALFAWTLGGEQFIPGRAFGGLLIFLAMILSELPIERIGLRSGKLT